MEWRLFDPEDPPEFLAAPFFEHYPWIDPQFQPGFQGRINLAALMAVEHVAGEGLSTVVDLGCGDGSLLYRLRLHGVDAWGYDLGADNAKVARSKGLTVVQANVFTDPIRYGDLITCTEMVEHLVDPYQFLHDLPGHHLLISSPAFETDQNHYEHHAWAWDESGYDALVRQAGWVPREHRLSPEGFQILTAVRP